MTPWAVPNDSKRIDLLADSDGSAGLRLAGRVFFGKEEGGAILPG